MRQSYHIRILNLFMFVILDQVLKVIIGRVYETMQRVTEYRHLF